MHPTRKRGRFTIDGGMARRLLRSTCLTSIAAALGAGWPGAQAATYYVDPATGDDANAGTSQGAPWRSIPGMRNAGDTGWLRPAWGSIDPARPLQPGDVVELKAGATIDSSVGGKLIIDSTFYADGTADAPITIRVSPDWGSGHFTYDAGGMATARWTAAVEISGRDHISLKGVGEQSRFVLSNARGDWGLQIYGAYGDHVRGNAIDYVEIAQAAEGGFNVAFADGWTVSRTLSHDNGAIGFAVGTINDQNASHGLFVDSEAYRNGLDRGPVDIAHGFGLYGHTSDIRFVRCTAHGNGRDGFDFGTSSNTNDSSATVVDSAAHDNGEDGFAANGGTGTNQFVYINSISYGNGQAGWHIYNGPVAELYHVVAHDNGDVQGFGGNVLIYSEAADKAAHLTIMNSILYKPRLHAQYGAYGRTDDLPTIVSDNNLYVPRSSDAETFAEYPWGTPYTYAAPPTWVGPNDRLGVAHDPQFVAIGTAGFAANDYRVTAASPARGRGVLLGRLVDALKTREGAVRADPPDIGAF